MNSVIPVRITFRTTFFDSFRSRQIVLIPLPSVKCSRLIFAIVSTISIPCSASDNHRRHNGPNPRSVGSLLDADHPRSGVLIPRRSTANRNALRDGAIAAGLSFMAALAALALMMRLLRSVSFTPYVVYRIVLGVALLAIAYV